MEDNNTSKNSKIHNMFQKIRHQFIGRHYYGITASSRVLPDFIIIGSMKSGTTSLYYNICEHPCVKTAAYDEIGYFDVNYHLGINWYRSMFPTLSQKKKILQKFGYFKTGEDTPFYFWNKLAAKRIHHDLPNVKLIAILRNPIDRAYSEYQNGLRNKTENRKFEQIVEHEIEEISKSQISVELCSKNNAIISRGLYAKQLELWKEKISKNELLIIQTEKFSQDTQNTMNQVFDYLELPKYEITKTRKEKSYKYPKMNEKTREKLLEFFKPHNEELYKMLGYKLNWEN